MQEIVYHFDFELPIRQLWNLINSFDEMVTMIPGYISHEMKGKDEIEVSIQLKWGLIKKRTKMKINITKRSEPHLLSFSFVSGASSIKGNCLYIAESPHINHTNVTINLNIIAQGAIKPMIQTFLKNYELSKEKVEKITEMVTTKVREVG